MVKLQANFTWEEKDFLIFLLKNRKEIEYKMSVGVVRS